MRTTVTLDADVEAGLKNVMRQRDVSFKQALNDAIRAGLMPASVAKAMPIRLPAFRMGQPRVDLTKALALAAELDDQDTLARQQAREAGA